MNLNPQDVINPVESRPALNFAASQTCGICPTTARREPYR